MNDLVAEDVARKLPLRIAQNEQTTLGMNSAGPLLQFAQTLELLPVLGALENIDVRFDVGEGLIALQFFRHHAIMKLGFDRDWRRDIAMHEVVNEMLGLAVLPLCWINAERFFAERIGITLAELGEFNFR